MATCDNCGHTQSDFLASDDIEAIQLRAILLDGRCTTLQNENDSLKAMLKTQSEHHQTRVQELLNGIRGIKHIDSAEAEGLRRDNEILKSAVFEMNLKLKSSVELAKDLKTQLDASLEETERTKELLKQSAGYLKELENELVEALEAANTVPELSVLRHDDQDILAKKDMILQRQLEESFGSSLKRIKNVFNSSDESSLGYRMGSDSSAESTFKSASDLSSAPSTETSSSAESTETSSSSAESSYFSPASVTSSPLLDKARFYTPPHSTVNENVIKLVKKEDYYKLKMKEDSIEPVMKEDSAEPIKKDDSAEPIKKEDSVEPVKKEDSINTTDDESDIEVVEMTDEISDLVF